MRTDLKKESFIYDKTLRDILQGTSTTIAKLFVCKSA